jgi:hypothetical protein
MDQTVSICNFAWTSLPSFYFVLRCVIIFVGISSNVLLLIGMTMDPLKCFKNASSYLILNLSITDILTGVVWILVQYWQPCIDGISFHPFILLPPYVACFYIFTMAFDRYMSCVHPFKYRILITRNVTFAVVSVQWFLSSVHLVCEMLYKDEDLFFYSKCIIAMVILTGATIMYSKAAYVLKNNSKYLKNAGGISLSQNNARHARFINEKRLLTTMFYVSCITITTMSPASIYLAVAGESFIVNEQVHQGKDHLHVWLAMLLFVNFSINPFMYTWRLKNYRATLKILIKKLRFY